MVEFKSREEFIAGLIQVLHANPNANVMVMVEGPGGLQTMQTTNSYVWILGVLQAAEKMFDERYRQAINAEGAQTGGEATEAAFKAAVKGPGGKAN
jgi:hypothetical protein